MPAPLRIDLICAANSGMSSTERMRSVLVRATGAAGGIRFVLSVAHARAKRPDCDRTVFAEWGWPSSRGRIAHAEPLALAPPTRLHARRAVGRDWDHRGVDLDPAPRNGTR